MKKQILKSGFFLKCLMVLLAIGWSTSAVMAAPSYFRVEIIPVLENGAVGKLFACDNSSANSKYYSYLYNIGKDGLWTVCSDESTHWEQTIEHGAGGGVQFCPRAQAGDKRTMFEGWYWDAACTERLKSSSSGSVTFTNSYNFTVSGNGRTLTSYPSAAAAEAGTKIVIYAKFVKTIPDFDWSTLGVTPMDEGKYYIYNIATGRFLQAPKTGDGSSSNKPGTTANPAEATLFTCDSLTIGTNANYLNKKIDDNGVTENRSYKECLFTYKGDDNVTRYASADGYSSWKWNSSASTNINYKIHVWSWESLGTNTFLIAKGDASGGNFISHLEVYSDGSLDYAAQGGLKRNNGFYWTFIPENALLSQSAVTSLNENGTVTIDASPTATGTAYVKFNVSSASLPAGFNYELTGGDGHFDIVEESVTCSGGVLTVPVTYTAQNVHAVSSPASTATVTVTSKQGGDPVSGTVTAYVDLQPKFALMVDELDWNAEGETFYKGMEIAASQRTYLSNKLIYNPAQTTGVAANNATWTATIEGTNADQFKFANGTREVSGAYSASLLDVIYAPTTTGEHTATLHIVTSYTASNGEQTYEKNLTLLGTGSAASRITFAANGSETPLTAESYNYGDIIGTNHKDVTAELFISQITSPSYVWNDPAEVFELDESTIDLTKKNQTLSFRAHPDNPVATNTDYTATLTVSGKGTANEDVSATLTLTYRALPLIQTTVTWNWETMKENRTVTNPISTNSDGVWVLTKTAGDAVTYNDASKSATAAYLHHEPGKTAAYILQIPQTDTYTAFEKEYETEIMPLPKHVVIDRKEYLGDNSAHTEGEYGRVAKWSGSWETWDEATKTLQVRGDNIWFYFSGQTKFEFDFEVSGSNSWTIKELDSDGGTIRTIQSYAALTAGHNVFTISPQTAQLNMKGNGKMTNIEYYEVDTISADYDRAALIRDGNNVSSLDITGTFSNKRQVTASLNATAAQYFEIRSTGKTTGSSFVFNGDDGLGIGLTQNKLITIALKDGVNVNEAQQASMGNTCVLTFSDDYTYNHEELSIPILIVTPSEITYKHSPYGTYVVTYSDNVPNTVSSADYVKTITETDPALYVVTLSAPTVTTSGYVFQGWKINNTIVSCRETFTTSVGVDGSVVEAAFVPTEAQNFKVGDVYFAELGAALSAANTSADSKVVTLMQDVTLGDGTTPVSYTIPAGITLLIPHKADFYELQETPELVVRTQEVLSAYRTLTLKQGVTINCDGNICIAGKMLTDGGGNKSAYTTGECGVINMANGGHIELNDGAQLYCWGYIKGQDMDQGNNTQGTGTVTAQSGATIWENFELGDWRGGSASLDIYNNNVIDHRKLFPFQSYAIQNIEIPTTFNYGSTLRTYTNITTGMGNHGAVFAMIGSSETMFKLEDANSVVRTWYDPTTDLTCYALSGTAKLDALHVTVYVEMSSEDFILPVSNSMHIILEDDLNLVNPLMAQAGSVIEIKPTATVNLSSELYLYDKDQWGKYVHNYYFRSFNNLTSHKDRGAEDSKDGLDDAKLIVDGVLNVQDGGKIYTTAGGANVMGNGGGELHFKQALPGPERLWAVTVIGELPYIKWEYNDATAANLCNEDGSYTRSIGGATFYNVHGRWFDSEDKDAKADHTYNFRYMAEGNNGEDVATDAVYSHDKTGLEERMKWFNVESVDDCDELWQDASGYYYNYTMLGEWHQFIAAEGGVYSGSNNVLYLKDGCNFTENGYIDENCLYTIGGVKKALVDGVFIPLTPNGDDPAYHATANASQYYICFKGCNWHPATKYAGESKAYTINPETGVYLHYIWFEDDWLNVLRDGAFFYTEDEQTNVRTYYEYLNGEWEIATPYVSVSDEAETRTFYMIKEAFNVASIKKDATITLLRDILNVTEVLTYTTQNTNCTLDLNGHLLAGNIANLVTVNAPGATFTITDNSDLKNGKISSGTASKAVYVQKGTLVVANGTIESTGVYAIEGAATTTITINGGYFAADTRCVNVNGSCSISGGHFNKNAGLATYKAPHTNVFETTDPKYRYTVETAWTITFKKDAETTLQTLVLKTNETPVYTEAQPTKENYKFTGWDHAIVPATEDATYMAVFEAIEEGEKCVTLNSNDGVEGLRYIYVASGSAVGTLPTATKEGHTFVGWFTAAEDGDEVNASTTVSANVTWYAHYTKNSYTLTWNANGGELSGEYTSGTVEFGAAITAPAVTKAGCEFLGWGVASVATTMPAHDVTYTAQWPIIAKHYLQNIDGTYPETPEATEVVSGEANGYVTPATKTYDGFITPPTQTVQIGVATEVIYQYARRTYTITLDANGGTCATASINVKHGATPTLPVATKDGNNCSGWFTKAIGGDKITDETAILYNIGTLYAQYADLNVTAPLTVSDTRTVTDVRITTTGALTITGSVTANNFILESDGSTASGQFMAGYDKLSCTHAYFDLKLNAKNHQWYAVAVPWPVDATNGISVNGRTLTLGTDFDIIYYNGARRAVEGKNKCWSYVEDDDIKTLVPGRLYMIGLMIDAATVRFEMKDGEEMSTTTTSVTEHNSVNATDAGWNGVANPALFHAFINPGTAFGQVYNPDSKSYSLITLNTSRLVVGEGAFVQAPNTIATINAVTSNPFSAPRRAQAHANLIYDVRIAPAEADYTDRLFVKTTDSKEAEVYTVGEDLAKVGVSSLVPQMWINRYGEKLCVNTQELRNYTATYPLGISVPAEGDYTINVEETDSEHTLYLTLDGRVIWNLSAAPYTAYMEAGTNQRYGLRLVANAPQVVTGIEGALIDANGEVRKVLIDNQIYIIRGENVYSVDGSLVK